MHKRFTAVFVALLILVAVIVSATVVEQLTPVSTDVNEDIEPAAISQVRPDGEYTVVVNMKFRPTAAQADQSITPPPDTMLPMLAAQVITPSGVVTSMLPDSGGIGQFDPVLAKDDASFNQPIYLVALVRGEYVDFNGGRVPTSTIVMWTSTNGGLSWSLPKLVVNEGPTGYVLDKPAIAVAAPNPQLRVPPVIYVSYVRAPNGVGGVEVLTTSSRNGGATWTTPLTIAPAVVDGRARANQAPQVVVDSNGDVYVLWADTSSDPNQIHIKKSSMLNPLAFSSTELPAIATGRLYNPGGKVVVAAGVSVRAVTVPIAKLDAVHRTITVTWHEQVSATDPAPQIRVASRVIGRLPWFVSAPFTTGIDFQPSLDFDPSGGYMLTFYHFTGSTYQQGSTYVTFLFSSHQFEPPMYYGPVSNIASYTNTGNGRLLGEYHDVTYSNGTFKSAAIYIDGTGDPWIARLQH